MAPKSTNFDFDFYESKPKELMYHGDAHFPKETAVLRLTKTDDKENPLQRSSGRVVYSKPVAFGHKADFETTVKFIIRPGTDKTSHADGLVFFVVPHGHAYPKEPPHGGNLGIFEQSGKTSHVFAAGFDIYPKNPGYISLGIYIQSRESPEDSILVPDSFIGKDLTLSVSYDSANHVISASATDDSETFPVSCEYDLSHILPPSVVVGLASSTGEYVAVHDINSWAFTSATS